MTMLSPTNPRQADIIPRTVPTIVPQPSKIIGVMGGGQLGRMLAQTAARLGMTCCIFAPEADAPAMAVTRHRITARYDDRAALDEMARLCSVVTVEFENLPRESLALLANNVALHPSPAIFSITQDRWDEKTFLTSIGVTVAPYADLSDPSMIDAALRHVGPGPAIMKLRRMGYDGKGQWRLSGRASSRQLQTIMTKLSPDDWQLGGGAILERVVRFSCELSITIARGADGKIATYDPVENLHRDGILVRTRSPALLSPGVARRVKRIGQTIAARLGLVGILTVEMFLTPSGELIVNELAARPHNSAHWTIDGAATCQFEQQLRAVSGLPLGSTRRFCDAEMTNLIGATVQAWITDPPIKMARLHLYGKTEIKPGRKMGHLTRLWPRGTAPWLKK